MGNKRAMKIVVIIISIVFLSLIGANIYDMNKFFDEPKVVETRGDHGCLDFVTIGICSDSTIHLENKLIDNIDSLSDEIKQYDLCGGGYVKIKPQENDILMGLVDKVEKELIEANIYRIEFSVDIKICNS